MASPNLTWFVIGIASIILILSLTTQVYVDIMDKNGGTIDTVYSAKYAEILGYQSDLTGFQQGLTQNRSIWTSIPSILGNTFNVLAMGITGVTTFFNLLDIIPQMFSAIFSALNLPTIFMWFILFVLGIYIVTKVYKAIKGQGDET